MSLIRTFTVTVQSTGGGNKYFIDGVQQDTVVLAEGFTYKFDQSDSSNGTGGTHPLRFSTTSDGSHSGGTQYTTGVTASGTPGQAGAYVQIEVAASAPQLYYYCTNHSGMGGAANTVEDDTWGVLQWGQNSWGNQDEAIEVLPALSATASVGTLEAFNEIGWGADGWGAEGWGGAESIIPLPAFSLTATVNLPSENVTSFPGWGTSSWGANSWGDVQSHTFTLTGLSATTSLGEVAVADAIGLTGLSATASLNSLPPITTDATFTLSGLSATASHGLFVLDDHSVGLGQLVANTSLGTLDPPDQTLGLSGLSSTTSVGSVTITSEPVISLTGLSLSTTLGEVQTGQLVELTAPAFSLSSSLGTVTTTQLSTVSLTGLTATTTVNDAELILKYYRRLTPKVSTGYTRKTPA